MIRSPKIRRSGVEYRLNSHIIENVVSDLEKGRPKRYVASNNNISLKMLNEIIKVNRL